MKIFHVEDGKEVVYVQMQDIIYLNETDIPIPASIFTKAFPDVTFITDSNRFDFVRFDEEHEVEFFKGLDFIIDFDCYKHFTDEQLDKEAHKFETRGNSLAEKWNSLNKEERRKSENSSIYTEYRNIGHILNFLSEIYAVKHRKRKMPFPDFVDVPKLPWWKCLFG